MFICDISIFNKFGKQKLDELLAPMETNWHELVVMLVIDQVPGITQARVIPFLQTDKANVTKLLQTMEIKGLIRRENDIHDHRVKTCHLTDSGKKWIPDLHRILDAWESVCFQNISEEDLSHFRRITEQITLNLVSDC